MARLPQAKPYHPEFKNRNAGHVINIGSIAGIEAYAGGSIYCATKHAVNAFTRALKCELVDTQIRVTEIQPGKSNVCLLSVSKGATAHRNQEWLRPNSL